MNAKTQNLIFWIIISAALLVLAIMHPRINNILVLVISIVKCIIVAAANMEVEQVHWNRTFLLLIGLAAVWFIAKSFDYVFPYHAPYEYKKDIRSLKAENAGDDSYAHFPDEIPECASKIEWSCVPGLMQGSHYETLFFYADEAYLSEIYNTYISKAEVYTYKGYGWENEKQQTITFPKRNDIMEEEKPNVTVFITYDNGEDNHSRTSGLYINPEQGYVCFFAQ